MKRKSTLAKLILTAALAVTMIAGSALAVGTQTSSNVPKTWTEALSKVLSNPRPTDVARDGELSTPEGYAIHQATAKNTMKIYVAADSKSNVKLTLSPGSVVLLIGAPVDGWQKIMVNSEVYYVQEKDLYTVDAISVPANAKIMKAKTTAIIRTAANGNAKQIATAKENTEIAVTGEQGNYYIVQFMTKNGVETGYVLKTALELEE